MLRRRLCSLGQRALLGARQFAAVPAVVPDNLPVPDIQWANSAAVLHGVNDMRFENFPLPDRVPSGNVRIEIKAVGICGSDVHYWRKVCAWPALPGPQPPVNIYHAIRLLQPKQLHRHKSAACGFVWGCSMLDISLAVVAGIHALARTEG